MINPATEQLAQYRENGFLVLPGVLNKGDVNELKEESVRLWDILEIDENNRRIQWRKRLDGSRVADRIDPVLDISPRFRQLANDPRITQWVMQLLGCEAPEVFKVKLISKWPQTTGYALHQDYTYWPGLGDTSPDVFLTALIALDSFKPKSGALELFPGLHHEKLPGSARYPDDVDEALVDLTSGELPALSPGDMVFFHSMTPHRSGPNLSSHNRQSLFITYVAPGYGNLGKQYYSERPDDFMEP